MNLELLNESLIDGLRLLFDTTLPVHLCTRDGEGRWIRANATMLKLFQLSDKDYRGKRTLDLEQDSPFHYQALMNCEATDEEVKWTLVSRHGFCS